MPAALRVLPLAALGMTLIASLQAAWLPQGVILPDDLAVPVGKGRDSGALELIP